MILEKRTPKGHWGKSYDVGGADTISGRFEIAGGKSTERMVSVSLRTTTHSVTLTRDELESAWQFLVACERGKKEAAR